MWYCPETKTYWYDRGDIGDGSHSYQIWQPFPDETVVKVLEDGSFVTEWKSKFGVIHRSYYNRQGKETKKVHGKSTEKFVRA